MNPFVILSICVLVVSTAVAHGPIDSSQATAIAMQSGNWSEESTWDGEIPGSGDKVLIPKGTNVVLNCDTDRLDWLQIDGVLEVDSSIPTSITAHTIVTGMVSRLEIGTEKRPAHCTITFTDGDFYADDFAQHGRGLIAMGIVEIHGVPKTHASENDVPLDWDRDDDILVLDPHAVNLTRSVVFRSESTKQRGHVMFMNPRVNCRYASFIDLGRTDKSQPVTDPEAGNNENPRARYALHFHRTGAPSPAGGSRFDSTGRGQILSEVVGCVVNGSPGWGFVNHVGNVEFRECVAINVFGAGFATEEGDEAGAFINCIAANCVGLAKDGNPDNVKGIAEIADWGKAGDGFWLQAPLVETLFCTAYNCSGAGYNIFDFEFNIGGGHGSIAEHLKWPITIEPSRLPKPILSDVPLRTRFIPCQTFAGNRAYGCNQGLQRWSDENPWGANASISNFVVRGFYRKGVNLEYSHGNLLENISVSNGWNNSCIGIHARHSNLTLTEFDVSNCWLAVKVPTSGVNLIRGGRIGLCDSAFALAGPEKDAITYVEDCEISECGIDVNLTPNIKKRYFPNEVVFSLGRRLSINARQLDVNGETGEMELGTGSYEATNDRGSYYFSIE